MRKKQTKSQNIHLLLPTNLLTTHLQPFPYIIYIHTKALQYPHTTPPFLPYTPHFFLSLSHFSLSIHCPQIVQRVLSCLLRRNHVYYMLSQPESNPTQLSRTQTQHFLSESSFLLLGLPRVSTTPPSYRSVLLLSTYSTPYRSIPHVCRTVTVYIRDGHACTACYRPFCSALFFTSFHLHTQTPPTSHLLFLVRTSMLRTAYGTGCRCSSAACGDNRKVKTRCAVFSPRVTFLFKTFFSYSHLLQANAHTNHHHVP